MGLHVLLDTEQERVHENMFAWHKGRRMETAVIVDLLMKEDAARRRVPLHMNSMDAKHWYDTAHQHTSCV